MMALAAIVVDSLVYASWLFIVSIGLTLIFGVMNVLNVAHGSLYALGAYTAAWGVGMYVGGAPDAGFVLLAIMLVAAIVVGVLVGILIERGVLRWVYGRDEIVIVLATYAVFLVLEDVMKLIFGAESYIAFQPRFLFGTISVAGIPYVGYDLLLVPLVALLGVGSWAATHRTRPGTPLIAVLHDRAIASALGLTVARFCTLPTGWPKLARFGKLMTSPRNCRVWPSHGMRMSLMTERSARSAPGAMNAFRPVWPNVKRAGRWNTDVLKNFSPRTLSRHELLRW